MAEGEHLGIHLLPHRCASSQQLNVHVVPCVCVCVWVCVRLCVCVCVCVVCVGVCTCALYVCVYVVCEGKMAGTHSAVGCVAIWTANQGSCG